MGCVADELQKLRSEANKNPRLAKYWQSIGADVMSLNRTRNSTLQALLEAKNKALLRKVFFAWKQVTMGAHLPSVHLSPQLVFTPTRLPFSCRYSSP